MFFGLEWMSVVSNFDVTFSVYTQRTLRHTHGDWFIQLINLNFFVRNAVERHFFYSFPCSFRTLSSSNSLTRFLHEIFFVLAYPFRKCLSVCVSLCYVRTHKCMRLTLSNEQEYFSIHYPKSNYHSRVLEHFYYWWFRVVVRVICVSWNVDYHWRRRDILLCRNNMLISMKITGFFFQILFTCITSEWKT